MPPKTLNEFLTELGDPNAEHPFRPCAFYNKDGDALEIYLSQEPHIAERVNTLITIFVATNDREKVAGLVIKNIKKHFGPSGLSRVVFSHKRASLRVLLLGALYSRALILDRRKGHNPDPASERSARIGALLDQIGDTEVDLQNTEALAAK